MSGLISSDEQSYETYPTPSSDMYGCTILKKESGSPENIALENVECGHLEDETSSNARKYNGICQYQECKTKDNKKCVFPFRYIPFPCVSNKNIIL